MIVFEKSKSISHRLFIVSEKINLLSVYLDVNKVSCFCQLIWPLWNEKWLKWIMMFMCVFYIIKFVQADKKNLFPLYGI